MSLSDPHPSSASPAADLELRALEPGVDPLVADVLHDVLVAVDRELEAMATADATGIELTDGRPVGQLGAERLWSFEISGDVVASPDTPGMLVVPGLEPTRATVLAVGDTDVVLGVREELGEAVGVGELRTEPAFIYEALRARLSAALADPDTDDSMLAALLDLEALDDSDAVAPGEQEPSESQSNAASRATLPGLHFVWGPPGTGKTTTLARTVADLARRGRRVLVVSHANAAVDVAMVRLAEALDNDPLLQAGKVLRVGTPQLPAARSRTDILPDAIVSRSQPDLWARRTELDARRRALSRILSRGSATERDQAALELQQVREELAGIERAFAEARGQLIRRATVLGGTLARFVIDDLIWNWYADAIVVDEGSMAGLPYVFAAALRNPETLSIFGDFRQLPPIAVSNDETAQHWLGRDVFEVAGIVDGVERGIPDPRLSMLRMNYRMAPTIGSVVSDFAYYGLLDTHEQVAGRAAPITKASPFPGQELVIVDLSGLSTCLVEQSLTSFSRCNLFSAALVRTLLDGIDSRFTVGVISPYRAQTRIHAATTRGLEHVVAATTHRFQGSERDVIVLDLTDAPPLDGPSRLTGRQPDLALRLLNVGASRAVGKLVVVADLEFLEQHAANDAPPRQLLDLMRERGAPVVPAVDYLAGGDGSSVAWWPSWATAAPALAADLARAVTLDVSLPDRRWVEPVHVEALEAASRTASAVVVRTSVDAVELVEHLTADVRLRVPGPSPLAVVDTHTIWIGSRQPEGPVARLDSERVARTVRRMLFPAE